MGLFYFVKHDKLNIILFFIFDNSSLNCIHIDWVNLLLLHNNQIKQIIFLFWWKYLIAQNSS